MTDPLVDVQGLEKHYYEQATLVDQLLGNETVTIHAVDGVSFNISKGETLGLIGESGCGKSTVGETIVGLQQPTAGCVTFDGTDVFDADRQTWKQLRQRVQMIFQDPFASLNPRMSAGDIVREPLDVHDVGTPAERRERVAELLAEVGLSEEYVDRNPQQFSGGQAQRLGIARALALNPDFIVCDEPVSALDVSVQAQILNLFADIQDEFDLTFLFIAHDLSVIRMISDRVAVMYLGKIVETGTTEQIFNDPQHPYTEALLESVPRADLVESRRRVEPIPGDVPSPRDPPSGCRFHTRCPYAREVCKKETPEFYSTGADSKSACFRVTDDHSYWETNELNTDANKSEMDATDD